MQDLRHAQAVLSIEAAGGERGAGIAGGPAAGARPRGLGESEVSRRRATLADVGVGQRAAPIGQRRAALPGDDLNLGAQTVPIAVLWVEGQRGP